MIKTIYKKKIKNKKKMIKDKIHLRRSIISKNHVTRNILSKDWLGSGKDEMITQSVNIYIYIYIYT
jgi:hypothetical protein